MIEIIRLNQVTPNVFVGSPPDGGPTDVWGQELTFKRGESCLIEAASGRGKSSFCTFLYGLRTDYVGAIEYYTAQGEQLQMSEAMWCEMRCRSLGMMFQEHRIFPELTAVENVMLKNQLTDYFTEQEIRTHLSALGLEDRLDRPCGLLSIGQQQRVAFVRLLAQPADFLILDEPVSHLDATNSQLMGNMLRHRQEQEGVAVIVTSIGHRLPYEYDRVLKL
jgi:ABC-type lipoprotein export system ATPase subunit